MIPDVFHLIFSRLLGNFLLSIENSLLLYKGLSSSITWQNMLVWVLETFFLFKRDSFNIKGWIRKAISQEDAFSGLSFLCDGLLLSRFQSHNGLQNFFWELHDLNFLDIYANRRWGSLMYRFRYFWGSVYHEFHPNNHGKEYYPKAQVKLIS